jgi:hypothetical protein
MSYIGSTPTTQSFISGTDYFNGDGSTVAFTLSRSVVSVNDIEAVINNVEQQPNTAYTVSGTTITFTSAPSAGTGNIYVRYLSTTTQSITPSQNTVSYSTLNSDNQSKLGISFKNRIINGAMVIDQRNGGASSSSSSNNFYFLDRWCQNNNSGTSRFTVQQNAGSVTPPAGFTNYLGVTSTGAYSITGNDIFSIFQRIEGYNIADLGWGTVNAKTVTLSFWVRSSLTGTFGGSLLNSGGSRSYPFTYTISTANTWEQKSVTIPGETTGTWLTTNGEGLNVYFNLGTVAAYSGTAGVWGSACYSATGAVSVVGTNGATLYLTGVQFEVGTQATTFDNRSIGIELALCQRYYETNFPLGVAPAPSYSQNPSDVGSIAYGTAATRTTQCWFKVTKRALPTVTLYSPAGYGNTNNNNFNIYVSGTWYNYTGSPNVSYVSFYLDGNGSGQSFTAGYSYLTSGNWSASSEL